MVSPKELLSEIQSSLSGPNPPSPTQKIQLIHALGRSRSSLQSLLKFPDGLVAKLPLRLAEAALDDFNFIHDIFYEDVKVIESLVIGISVKNIITLHITFEASLPPNHNTEQVESVTQTFGTKISLSFPDPALAVVKIGFHSVKIKEEEDPADYEEAEEELDRPLYVDDDPGAEEQYYPDTLTGFGCGEYSKITGERISKSDEKILSKSDEKILSKSDEKNLSQFDSEKHSEEKRVLYYCHPGANFKPLTLRKFKGSKLSEEIESFKNDLKNSGGFDVGYYPLMVDAGIDGFSLFKFYDHLNKPVDTSSMNRLVCYSRLALCVYNIEENTYFDLVKVLRAITSGCAGVKFNITFEASLPDSTTKTFQTRISASIPFPYTKVKIEFVRVKSN